jgi:predicted TIM-barrel fold metal-dependent hydrolase
MPHVLAKLKNVPLEIIKDVLEKDKAFHASQGMYLERLWQNADDENEVQFLFRIDNIEQTKALIHKLHSDALAQDPNANLPEMTYLKQT